jgi:DNA-directed RNA polymerase subunit F
MKIVQSQVVHLTNSEVLQILEEHGCGNNHPTGKALPSEREVFSYLSKYSSGVDLEKKFPTFMKAVKSFGLTKSEVLQICNLRPSQMVDLYLIVEGCEERLVEEQVGELLDLIRTHLGNTT